MLSVYTKEGFIPIETRQDYYYLMNYDGLHQLSFDVSVNDSINKHLINEAVIQNEDNRFLIKDINRRTKNITVTCELDMDEWKQKIFFDTAVDVRFQTKLLGDILNVIKPNGWSVSNAGIRTIKRTPELKDCTPYDVLVSLENTFNVVFDINVIKKEIRVIDPESFEYDGLYATPELNMKGVTWQGSSSDFCTRLFAYGKQDDSGNTTNIASINSGKEYIEDHTYTDKVITLVWRDERYTDPQSLYDDARKKLDILCVPKMSYDISIYDLSQMNKEYDFLQFGLYKMVKTIVNEDVSILQRVVTYKKYYDKPDKNVITLSNEQQKFTSKVSNILGGSTNEIIHGSFLEQAQKESAVIIEEFAKKGHRYETDNETYFLDALPKEKAKYVMRMNLGGIAFSQNGWAGPYTTAWTIDGKFNADFIAAGTLQAIKISGGSINIGNGTFVVDSNGNLKMTKGSINIGKKFIVDENGNLTVDGNGKFVGEVSGSTIRGSNIVGSALSSQSGTLLVSISNGKLTFINSKNSTLIDVYAADVVITQGDDITGKGDLVFDSSITSKAQIQSVGNLYSNKNAQIAKICYAQKFQNISDIRKKENVENIDLTGIFDYVDIKKFNYINDIEKSVGVIAQDFIGTPYEDIILRKDTQGYYTVDYNVFALACIQKNQQLEKRLDSFVDILKSKGVLE